MKRLVFCVMMFALLALYACAPEPTAAPQVSASTPMAATAVPITAAPERRASTPQPPTTLPIPTAAPGMPASTPMAAAALTPPTALPPEMPLPSSATGQWAVVAWVKDGDIQVWDEATGQSHTIFSDGDAIDLRMSDDGQVVAFLRRSVVKRSDLDWYEQSALWAVDLSGDNPRELVSADELRRFLKAEETDSTNVAHMQWIPGTHRLLFSPWKYIVQAEGESHAIPEGLYSIDADTPAAAVELPISGTLRFVPSPDGQKIALMSEEGLGFIDVNGQDYVPDVLTYPRVALQGSAIPSGVWTQDSTAFLIASTLEVGPDTNTYAIWRVPVDGSPAENLVAFTDSHPDSVTFSPNGRHAAYYRGSGLGEFYGWFVTDLPGEQGPLAIPRSVSLSWQNLHWSPAGLAYAVTEGTLSPLCPDVAQDAEVCGERMELGGDGETIHWLDGTRFVLVTRESQDLYLGRLDGTRVRIAAGVGKFAATPATCRNASDFAVQGAGPDTVSVAPDTLFQMVWRVRNTGTCTWNTSYRLGALNAERLSGPRSLQLAEIVPPDGEIELSLKLIAPAATGTHRAEWQLFAPEGRPFGIRLPVEITVPSYAVADLPPDLLVAKVPTNVDAIAFGEGAIWANSWESVSRIDPETNQVLTTIPMDGFVQSLAIGFGAVWVSSPDGSVIRIDPSTNEVGASTLVDPSGSANGVAIGAGSVWVSSSTEGTVSRIDPQTNQVTVKIAVGRSPFQIAITPDAVWVSDPNHPVLTRIDPATNEVSAEIRLDCATRGLAADAKAIWVACDSAPTLYRVDPLTNRIAARIAVGRHSRAVAITAKGVWVTSPTDETMTVVDPDNNQVVAVYRGDRPGDLVVAQGDLWMVVGSGVWRMRP